MLLFLRILNEKIATLRTFASEQIFRPIRNLKIITKELERLYTATFSWSAWISWIFSMAFVVDNQTRWTKDGAEVALRCVLGTGIPIS